MPEPRHRWGIVPAIPAGSKRAAPPGPWRKLARPPSARIEQYGAAVEIEIPGNNVATVTLNASGGGTAQIGPQGLGTRWRVTMASITTTVGPTDPATAIVYTGTQGVPSAQAAQSYTAGGDVIGLNSAIVDVGSFVIATWSGGTAGSVATLIVYGTQRSLVPSW